MEDSAKTLTVEAWSGITRDLPNFFFRIAGPPERSDLSSIRDDTCTAYSVEGKVPLSGGEETLVLKKQIRETNFALTEDSFYFTAAADTGPVSGIGPSRPKPDDAPRTVPFERDSRIIVCVKFSKSGLVGLVV